MKRAFILCKRNLKETVRDPLSLVFCLAFPIGMLLIMELIYKGLGVEGQGEAQMFAIESFAPGIAVFGYTFVMLFTALGISSDKNGAFMTRLLISPVRPFEYYLSFVFSALPICLCQTVIFYIISFIFGLKVSANLLVSIVYLIPSMLFYISCGLLIGAVAKTEKQAGPMSSIFICGAGMLGGVWMPLEEIGGSFLTLCKILPFYNTVNPASNAINGNFSAISPCVFIVLAYTVVFFTLSAFLYKIKSKK